MDAVKSRSSDGMLVDNVDGVVDYLHYDEVAKNFTHEIVQDVEPILEDVKARAALSNGGRSLSRDMYHAARVPTVVVHAWLKKRGLTMQDLKGSIVDDLLNDPDNAAWRIWKGRC